MEQDKWVSVDDRKPDDKIYVLLYHPIRDLYSIGYLYKNNWCLTTLSILPLINFTHWQPLPKPPQNNNSTV